MRTYEKYKDSGVSWLQGQQIPCGWTTCKLKNTAKSKGCLFIDGDWIESKNIIPDSNIIYTTTGNVGPGYFKYQSLGHISEQTFVDLNCTEVEPGDLVISRLNEPIGRACIFPKLGDKMITAVDNVVLRPDLEKYNKRYLMYQMNSPKYTISANLVARGATMHRISRSMLGDIQLIVPPLYEQEAIANYLDKKTAEIDKIIAEREKKIELLNELKSSIISRAVTKGINPHAKMKDSGIDWFPFIPCNWEYSSLRHVCKKITDGSHFSPMSQLEGKPYITVTNVRNNKVYVEEALKISDEDFRTLVSTGCQPLPGDILLSKDGTVGRTAIVTSNDYVVLSSLGILRPSSLVDSKYLEYCLNSNALQMQMQMMMDGSALRRITIKKICNLLVLIPPMHEQLSIVKYLDKKIAEVNNSISTIRKECALYKEYKQSLISEVVTGKRKVID